MNVEEFIGHLEEEFDDVNPGALTPESEFGKHFDMNSINALIMIALVSTEYSVIINADDLQVSKTINDLFNIIKGRVE